mgnify:CR=1 FL=1
MKKSLNEDKILDSDLQKRIVVLMVVIFANISIFFCSDLRQKTFLNSITDYAPLSICIMPIIVLFLKNYFKSLIKKKNYSFLIILLLLLIKSIFVFSKFFIDKRTSYTWTIIFYVFLMIVTVTISSFTITSVRYKEIPLIKPGKSSEFFASFLMIFILSICIFLSYFSKLGLIFTGYFIISMYETLFDILSSLENEKIDKIIKKFIYRP